MNVMRSNRLLAGIFDSSRVLACFSLGEFLMGTVHVHHVHILATTATNLAADSHSRAHKMQPNGYALVSFSFSFLFCFLFRFWLLLFL